MQADQPILELAELQPFTAPGELPSHKIDLTLMPGDVALVDVRDRRRAAWFADLCVGLGPPAEGTVRFRGRDWVLTPEPYAAALRGHVGRIFTDGGWIGFLDVATNILLA